tara:strand:+ start:60 stop:806 length:747 start_codon:yes stop_codon:yes gene_type:complete
MAGAGVLRLAAKVLAKKLARKPKNVVKGNYWEDLDQEAGRARLPESIEFLRGYAKRKEMSGAIMDNDPTLAPDKLKKLLKTLPTHVDTVPMRRSLYGEGKLKNLFRGETLYPDETLISKTGMANDSGISPGNWWSAEPFESAGYAIRPSKGSMGIGIENPGVMRRMKVNKNIDELKDIQNQGTGPTHFHPTDEMTGEAKISMFYSVISRLRELGYKEADIFKYIKMISKKKKASGESDWMLYNSGGKV